MSSSVNGNSVMSGFEIFTIYQHARSVELIAALGFVTRLSDATSETNREGKCVVKLKFPQEQSVIDQDIATLALLLFAVLYVLLFPGGPGTPRRLRNLLVPVRANLGN